jgi:outer membrane lipoprotein-sorting protein
MSYQLRTTSSSLIVLLLVCLLVSAWQVNPSFALAMDGKTLAQRVYDRDDGKDVYAKVEMLLIDKHGNERLRTMITANKDFGSLSKGFTRFLSPAAIEGTGFLYWQNEERDDDQFIYLPALRRVRRIVTTQKDNRFVNTDYTYEDMQKRKVEKDNHKILGTERIGDYDCWILESFPKDSDDSQYGKCVSWVVKDTYVPVKTEYYDKKGRLEKVYTARGLSKIDGIWTVTQSEMRDLKREHRTLMRISGIKYNSNIPDSVFTRRYLQEGR